MNRVAVIMSTYNGEAYVREQLESILNQRDVEVSTEFSRKKTIMIR